jgi:hypothetical protein
MSDQDLKSIVQASARKVLGELFAPAVVDKLSDEIAADVCASGVSLGLSEEAYQARLNGICEQIVSSVTGICNFVPESDAADAPAESKPRQKKEAAAAPTGKRGRKKASVEPNPERELPDHLPVKEAPANGRRAQSLI